MFEEVQFLRLQPYNELLLENLHTNWNQ